MFCRAACTFADLSRALWPSGPGRAPTRATGEVGEAEKLFPAAATVRRSNGHPSATPSTPGFRPVSDRPPVSVRVTRKLATLWRVPAVRFMGRALAWELVWGLAVLLGVLGVLVLLVTVGGLPLGLSITLLVALWWVLRE